jgi:hypothetical protein
MEYRMLLTYHETIEMSNPDPLLRSARPIAHGSIHATGIGPECTTIMNKNKKARTGRAISESIVLPVSTQQWKRAHRGTSAYCDTTNTDSRNLFAIAPNTSVSQA